ncbi:LysR family transcriptional regulator [Kibdelosporangium aridum]|uniref:LysR family transcriptional regulator n=1 Tax=Kibdelosporangium aridum TaxID=2030 RepID=A0A428Z7S3_KIBAR|nr:LysR family transcriptional regulator [Kibdelosporangium aridum]RSM83854.1 LysR family transcriptional regulator [Kibdelosporangium aridum]
MLDIVRLRVLAAVAAHGSVTAAAQALHYSQPSVSHHLARLEAETGARLTQRVGRGIRLTAEGELLAKRANEIIGRVDAASAELSAMVGLQAGRVRIAAFTSALSVLVPPAAAAMRELHPNIELHLTDAHPVVASQQLRDGEVDLAIVFHYDDATPDDGIRYSYLLDDPVYLLGKEPGRTLEDDRDSTWIAGCVNCRAEVVDMCQAAGFTPRIAYVSDDIIVKQALVAAGLGVTTMPGLALRSHHADGVVASELPFRRRISIATFGEPPDPPATAAFIAALSSTQG